jgi:copper chaperone CopZ
MTCASCVRRVEKALTRVDGSVITVPFTVRAF